MLTLVLALAAAAAPGLGLPPWPLSPDGELVAAPPGVVLVVSGGEAVLVAPGLWRVVPAEGVREVALQAGPHRAVAPVEPPPGRIELAFAPERPVKGQDVAVTVDLVVRARAGELDGDAPPPRVTISAGRLGPLEPQGPGRYRATFTLPTTRFPEPVAFLAVVPRCPRCATPRALGAAWLPLPAAVDLPGRSDPGVSTTVEIGGTTWGPVTADRGGRFQVPVVVPPGAGTAAARSVSARGNQRRFTIELGLPPVPRVACLVEPPRLPADGRSTAAVLCTACGPEGSPAPGAPLALGADRGEVTGGRWDGVLFLATYRAPRGGAGEAELTASWPAAGAEGRATAVAALVTGPPASIDWRLEGEPLAPGAAGAASAVARDGRGDPLGPARATGPHAADLAAGRLVAPRDLGDGVERVTLAFELPPTRQAAWLSLRREGREWIAEARGLDARPAEGVPLRFGSGATAVTDATGSARVRAAGPAEWVTGPDGLRAAGWSWAPPPGQPVAVGRQVDVALRPAGPVDVAASLDGRWLRWSVSAEGGPARRPVQLRAGAVRLGPPAWDGAVGRCEVLGGSGPVAVVDEQSGVAAVVEVP